MLKNSYLIPLSPLVLLLIPFVGMQFSNEVQWSLFDFVLMSVILTGVGFGIQWVVNFFKSRTQRWTFILLILVLFFLLWAELAVGIFNSPIAGS